MKPNQLALTMAFVGTAWLLPALWIGLSYPVRAPYKEVERTMESLKQTKSILSDFAKANKRVPLDLAEALAWARAEKKDIQRYDYYGQRLSYERLTGTRYFLRSFGRDGRQTRYHGQPDIGAINFRPASQKSLSYRYSSVPTMDIFPAALLAGAQAPGKDWHAQLFQDTETHQRTLMALRQDKPTKVMIAPHDRIEEFLWLPDGLRIVYTATNSQRYADGLFVWHLVTDQVENLAKSLLDKRLRTPVNSDHKLWISLAGVNVNGPTVYAYAKTRVPGAPLDPEEFFNKAQLTAVRVPEGKTKPSLVPAKRLADLDAAPFSQPLDLSSHVETTQMSPLQKQWLDLSLHGDMETVLVRWQEFSQKQNRSILFPYCLWYLSSIYAESFSVMRTRHTDDSEVLRSYGVELAEGLLNLEYAPTYLQSLALFTFNQLMEGNPLPYRFAHLTTEPIQPPPEPLGLPPEPKKTIQFPEPEENLDTQSGG